MGVDRGETSIGRRVLGGLTSLDAARRARWHAALPRSRRPASGLARLAGVALTSMLIANIGLGQPVQSVQASPAPAVAAAPDSRPVEIEHYFYSIHHTYDAPEKDNGEPIYDGCDGLFTTGKPLSDIVEDNYDGEVFVGEWVKQGVCAQNYGSRVQFDLSQLSKVSPDAIKQARFEFGEEKLSTNKPGLETAQDKINTCIKRINAVAGQTADGQSRYFPELYGKAESRVGRTAYDITPAVKRWLSGEWENYGVGLRWSDDDADATETSHLCLSALRGMRLVVTYATPSVADLQVTGLEVHNKAGAAGCSSDGLNTLTVVVRNTGDAAPAKPVDMSISYGLQTDHVETVRKTMPGAITAGPGGEQRIDFAQLQLGADTTLINVTIDGARAVTLQSHADPSFQGNVTCITRGVDLSIKLAKLNGIDLSSADAKGACVAGEKNGVMITISNLGDKDPLVFNSGVLIDGKLVKQASVGGVSPHSDKQSYVGDFAIPAGTHTIQVIADPDRKVSEENESNNTSPAVTVTCPAK